ncbi:Pectin acetylesterase 8, partial [Linum grandiflorum]
KDIAGAAHIQTYFNQVVSLYGSVKNLPASCTRSSTPSLCFFPQNVIQQVRTPIFLLNSAYDSWQIRNILAPADGDPRGSWNAYKLDIRSCSPLQLKTMQ